MINSVSEPVKEVEEQCSSSDIIKGQRMQQQFYLLKEHKEKRVGNKYHHKRWVLAMAICYTNIQTFKNQLKWVQKMSGLTPQRCGTVNTRHTNYNNNNNNGNNINTVRQDGRFEDTLARTALSPKAFTVGFLQRYLHIDKNF